MKSQPLWTPRHVVLSNICMAPVHLQGALTSPCARQFIIPTRGSVCPPTSKVAISSLSGVSKETWLSLISPLEMPDPFGTTQEEFSFAIHQQVLLPALSSQSASRHNFSANSPHTVSRTTPSRFKPINRHADRRSMRINLKFALHHDHILHCGCSRRLIHGTLNPESQLQFDLR